MEVKMTMEEYKELEKAKQDYESLKKEIKNCAEVWEEPSKNPNKWSDITAKVDLKKLEKVLLRNIDFVKDTDIDKIKFKNVKGE